MVKGKSLDTIRLKEKHHSMPRCMVQFKEAFEKMTHVEEVGILNYRIKTKPKKQFIIKGYDSQRESYRVEVNYDDFSQIFYLKVLDKNKKSFLRDLKNKLNSPQLL